MNYKIAITNGNLQRKYCKHYKFQIIVFKEKRNEKRSKTEQEESLVTF